MLKKIHYNKCLPNNRAKIYFKQKILVRESMLQDLTQHYADLQAYYDANSDLRNVKINNLCPKVFSIFNYRLNIRFTEMIRNMENSNLGLILYDMNKIYNEDIYLNDEDLSNYNLLLHKLIICIAMKYEVLDSVSINIKG